jgi:hypothetical protein
MLGIVVRIHNALAPDDGAYTYGSGLGFAGLVLVIAFVLWLLVRARIINVP